MPSQQERHQGGGHNGPTIYAGAGRQPARRILAAPSLAQDYPPAVRIIVPFGAGGPADVAARLIGNVLQESFGQPFVVENRTGAGGVIGTRRGREVAARRLHAADDVEHPDRERIAAADSANTS